MTGPYTIAPYYIIVIAKAGENVRGTDYVDERRVRPPKRRLLRFSNSWVFKFALLYIQHEFCHHFGQRAGLDVLRSQPEAVEASLRYP